MALIKTINEIKAVLPRAVSNLSATSLLPNFDRAERKYLVPIIGLDLYNDFTGKYNAVPSTLDAGEVALLKHMQLVIAAYAFYDELAFTHALITDNGVRTANSQQLQKAVGWEYKDLKTALQNAAIDGIETLIQALVDSNNALWTGSAEYTAFKSLLINTGTEFNTIIALHQPLRTFWAIRTVVADAQENYLRNSIGPDLLEYLRDVAAPSDEETYIIKLLKKALANYTIKHACEQYSAQFDVNGFTVVSTVGDQDGETAGRAGTKDLLDLKMRACDRDGQAYLSKAMNELSLLHTAGTGTANFTAAYIAGPMASFKVASDRNRGNASRKLFRF
jgi:hypothetical protein